MRNVILSIAIGRNGDGHLALHYAAQLHKLGLINLALVIVVGQPLLDRAVMAKKVLSQYNLDLEIPVNLGSSVTNNVLWDETFDQDTESVEFDNAYTSLLRMFNPFGPGKRYTYIAAAGLNELQNFLSHYANQVVAHLEQVVVFSGVKLCSPESSGMLDASTNNMVLAQDELGFLAQLQNEGLLEEHKVPVTIVTKNLARAVAFDKATIESILSESSLELLTIIQETLQLYYSTLRLNPNDEYRMKYLPAHLNVADFWQQFTIKGKTKLMSPRAHVWDQIDRINFYDIYCLMVLILPELFDATTLNVIDPFSQHLSTVKVVGLEDQDHMLENIKSNVLDVLKNI